MVLVKEPWAMFLFYDDQSYFYSRFYFLFCSCYRSEVKINLFKLILEEYTLIENYFTLIDRKKN